MNIMYLSREMLDSPHGAGKAILSILQGISSLGHKCILVGFASDDFVKEHCNQPDSKHWRGGFSVWILRVGCFEYILYRPCWWIELLIAFFSFAARIIRKVDQLDLHVLRLFFKKVLAAEHRRRQLDVLLLDGHPSTVLAVQNCHVPKLPVLQVSAFVPFGPCAPPEPPEQLLRAYRSLTGFITFGDYPKKMIAAGIGVEAFKIPFSAELFGTPKIYDNSTSGYVVMINPCRLKGMDIFLALAREFPEIPFTAVPSWGTSEADIEQLERIPNITILPYQQEVEVLYRQTRVLLVPSLLPEFFGLVVVEAMLRGIPVIASDYAGLKESKLGVDYLIPVSPAIFKHGFSDFDVPVQNIQPWKNALQRLLADPNHYKKISSDSIHAAREYVQKASHAASDLEAVLLRVTSEE